MTTAHPTFQDPTDASAQSGGTRASLIEVDKALESWRDAGYDLGAAAGEPIDNSIEAKASTIKVKLSYSKDRKHVDSIAFADDGEGIDLTVLPNVLKMGYSSRYGQRQGLGRFGVGLKLAALSVATRIEVTTKPAGQDQIYRIFLDLDMIKSDDQRYIEAVEVDQWPLDYQDLMIGKDGHPVPHGTLVVWRKVDRLSSGGTYGTSLDQKVNDLRKFIARVYRRFLDKGLTIELDGKPITPHDPLFLMDNPRIIKRYGKELRGRIIDQDAIEIEGHEVLVTVALAPEEFRPREGAGGDKDSKDQDIREFQINRENAGKLSMLRNGREIYYDIVPRILPAGVDKIDRYIGIEVSFPAELDEYFQVRHVKRGAEPVSKLREELRSWLQRPVKQARVEIRNYWGVVKTKSRVEDGNHSEVHDAVERAERDAPRGQAGLDTNDEEAQQAINDLIEDMGIDAKEEPEKVEQVRQQIEARPISIVDAAWPGKELFEIIHLNGKAVLRLNHRHPFIREVYDPLKKIADNGTEEMTATDVVDLVRKAEMALDVLFLAYAKAENMHRDPSIFEDLRSYWGQHTQAYMKELLKSED